MIQTTTPTPSAGATNDDEFWAKQTEALLEHLPLRDLEKEVRKYQPFVGTGLSSEDIARRALDIAINEEVEECEDDRPLESYNMTELRNIARDLRCRGYSKLVKKKLIAMIKKKVDDE